MTDKWLILPLSHAALGLDCATQNKHPWLNEVRTRACILDGVVEVATCKLSAYVHYEVHDILNLEHGGGDTVKSFRRLRLVDWCRQARLSLSMWKVSLRAGPSFKPMYFIIMSLRSKRRAFPSISCFLKRSACGARTGSISLIYCMTSSTVHRLGSWPLGLGLSRKLPEPVELLWCSSLEEDLRPEVSPVEFWERGLFFKCSDVATLFSMKDSPSVECRGIFGSFGDRGLLKSWRNRFVLRTGTAFRLSPKLLLSVVYVWLS